LIAAHIEQGNLPDVVEAINRLQGVSHSYLRQHHYNLWFTLQTASIEEITIILSGLSGRFGIEFHNLPVERIFKLDVRFDAEDRQQVLLHDVEELPKSENVQLNTEERLILSKLQDELEIIAKPFDFLCGDGLDEKEVLGILLELIDKCVVRRIAGIVDHHKLGFTANVLFAGRVVPEHIVGAGKALARFGMVSHCYQRKATSEWPYALYAMMHGRSMGDIQHIINKFVESEKVDSYELLPTVAELKKQSINYSL
jgi:DNA-binding Lrp family transcriptional regulator